MQNRRAHESIKSADKIQIMGRTLLTRASMSNKSLSARKNAALAHSPTILILP